MRYSKKRKFLLEAESVEESTDNIPSGIGELTSLEDFLSLRRPAWSWGEEQFIQRAISPLRQYADTYEVDGFGNIVIVIGDTDMLFSCHTDTAGFAPAMWRRPLISKTGMFSSPDGEILGADDGTGCWIMSQMIRKGVKGTYIFHRAEEIGGLGSSHIADCNNVLLDGIKFAIALDRRGTSDVITHQMCGRCCSDEFAQALAEQLSSRHIEYMPDPGGTFTDTANYIGLVPECTNVSVGYYDEHTGRERQCIYTAENLCDVMMYASYWDLPCKRDPGEDEFYDDFYTLGGNSQWLMPDEVYSDDFYDLVYKHPEAAASLLSEYGIGKREFLQHLKDMSLEY